MPLNLSDGQRVGEGDGLGEGRGVGGAYNRQRRSHTLTSVKPQQVRTPAGMSASVLGALFQPSVQKLRGGNHH